ncbi:uncharacterized protein P174DRAFT_431543 [Aspergillus novofumigatus IBT 16806]|uniref:Uncharacterized protein n=1 Tax=Aspergillus novofumigatus (strain IBT 16806) TaxID=1392255 RepID=A0A2I1CAL4_ASPN1|nr:uncharacterized protein P174DRAFT_431543 [Aspergillus novofumigatus IBT 16806]PKX94636.1 hypothetical protein P174DRAFT_431543 [Aspergillus novofumigatus IBT 16806]
MHFGSAMADSPLKSFALILWQTRSPKGAAQGQMTAVFVGLVAVAGELVNIPHVEGLMPSTSQLLHFDLHIFHQAIIMSPKRGQLVAAAGTRKRLLRLYDTSNDNNFGTVMQEDVTEALLDLVDAFSNMETVHRQAHGITGNKKGSGYEEYLRGRRLELSHIRLPYANVTADDWALYRNVKALRLLPGDARYVAWAAALQFFLAAVKSTVVRYFGDESDVVNGLPRLQEIDNTFPLVLETI